MKICMLSELFYPFLLGGAERRYYEIALRLAERHEVTIYSLNFRGRPSREMHRGMEIIRVGAAHPLGGRSVPHLASYWPALLKAAADNCDIIDSNQGIASFSASLKPLTKKPFVATFHDIYWNQWNEYFSFPFSSLGKAMEFMWSKLDYSRIITVSPNTKRKMESLGFRPAIDVIPSGVDERMIKEIKSKKEKNTVVFVGRLVKYKNIDVLIRAFRRVQDRHPEAKLKILGTGPEEQPLKRLAGELKVNAIFTGFVTEKEKIRIIKSSAVLVNPSSVEGLGLILIESMACGTPVIAKHLDTYFFCDKNNSILYKKDEELAGSILGVLENGLAAKKISRGGLKTAKEFSWDNVSRKIENLYEELL